MPHSQLFGEADADEDVSPDSSDPEQIGDAGQSALDTEANDKGNVNRVSTRGWALSNNYDSKVHHLFYFHFLYHYDFSSKLGYTFSCCMIISIGVRNGLYWLV